MTQSGRLHPQNALITNSSHQRSCSRVTQTHSQLIWHRKQAVWKYDIQTTCRSLSHITTNKIWLEMSSKGECLFDVCVYDYQWSVIPPRCTQTDSRSNPWACFQEKHWSLQRHTVQRQCLWEWQLMTSSCDRDFNCLCIWVTHLLSSPESNHCVCTVL